jgi:hypothetical protein
MIIAHITYTTDGSVIGLCRESSDDIGIKQFSLSLLLELIRNVLYYNYTPQTDLIFGPCNGVVKGVTPGSGI